MEIVIVKAVAIFFSEFITSRKLLITLSVWEVIISYSAFCLLLPHLILESYQQNIPPQSQVLAPIAVLNFTPSGRLVLR